MAEVVKRTAWYLRRVPALQKLSERAMSELISAAVVHDLKATNVIYLAGDPAGHVYFVAGGRVHTQRVSDTQTLSTGRFGPLECFGDEALWGGAVHEDQAVAFSASIVVAVPATGLRHLLDQNAEAKVAMSAAALARRDALIRRLFVNATMDVTGRVASALLELLRTGVEQPDGIEIRVTQEQLGELAAAARETVSMELGELERAGVVLRRKRRVFITNPNRLAQVASDPAHRRHKSRAA